MKKTLLIISLLLLSATLQAQVWEFQISAESCSVVRQVDDTTVLIYAEDALSGSHFLLYKEGHPAAQVLTIPPDMHVRDVRLWKGKYVYFCGFQEQLSTKQAIVGWFDVLTAFGGTGFVDWTFFYSLNPTTCPNPIEMRRLELFNLGDTVCMAMVGDAIFCDDTIATVMSAYENGPLSWTGWVMAHKGHYKFTDVTCLSHLVVAVGTYADDTGCVVESFRRTEDFPAHPCDPFWAQQIIYGNPIGDVLVTKEQGDSAVLAHYDQAAGVRTVFLRLPFDTTSCLPTTPEALIVPPASTEPYNIGMKLWELTVVDGDTYLLQKGYYSTWQSMYAWKIRVEAPWSTWVEGWRLYRGKSFSLDVASARWVSSREPQLYLQGSQWPLFSTECQDYKIEEALPATPVAIKLAFEPYARSLTSLGHSYQGTLSEVKVTEICNFLEQTKEDK